MANQQENTKEPEKPKMSIDQLKYIVMEGGGARGNTYLGAIRALENQLSIRVSKINPENEPDGIEKIASITNTGNQKRKPGVLDFLKKDPTKPTEDTYIPIIEGVAGASAGAITTFGLALGLNSDEIDEVLKFDFTNFLREIDAGKYRMINETSELSIGEDDNLTRKQNEILNFRGGNALGLKENIFIYSLENQKTEIHGNRLKYVKRELFVGLSIKVIIDGILHNVSQVLKIIQSNSKNNWYDKFLSKIFGILSKNDLTSQTTSLMVSRSAYAAGLTLGTYLFLNKKSGEIKVTGNTLAAIFKDRGMFSGFQVREFFYDMMLFAATRDTYFQKRLIIYFNNIPDADKYKGSKPDFSKFNGITKAELTYPLFEIGSRHKTEFNDKAKKLFEHLQNITFRELWMILKVEYAAAVSNFTTNSPLYFSDKYTPNFRVLEAVGSSMSIPPAIRPVFNASDVVFEPHTDSLKRGDTINLLPWSKLAEIDVIVNGKPKPFVTVVNYNKSDGKKTIRAKFKKSDYDLYEYAVKKALQQHLLKSPDNMAFVDTNNLLELNTFLDEMQKILVGVDEKGKFKLVIWENQTVMLNDDEIIVDINLIKFFYNAQFKGLLLDGGYFNNIPFNYFRDKGVGGKIDSVLAIKLDGDYPPTFLNDLDMKIPKLKQKEAELLDRLDREFFLSKIDTRLPETVDFSSPEIELELIEKKIEIMFQEFVYSKLEKSDNKEVIKFKKSAIHRIVKAWHQHYGQHNNIKPWEIPRNILEIAFTGYAYGAKRGQIRDITDHSHIIPLYDYGVDTYDFALHKVDVLAQLAQKEAYKAIEEYFK
ncbi:MAG: patatin-like phospholipase family protein [Crocinitomicaceae bacterium]|nr:patatin-like phospholipase family protein [Crocinitomicaceae bacterium]MBK8925442.1 patatin-like phospholipase family protein [Crocinitomicaceae bacterium]